MWNPELRKNKLYALLLIGVGVVLTLLDRDATALVVVSLFAIPMFFAKENWIYEPEQLEEELDDEVYLVEIDDKNPPKTVLNLAHFSQ